jgi:DNA-binding beta-propeller fold protein YncE
VLDPSTYTVKKKITIPAIQRAVSALPLSTAFAVSGKDLYEIDLKKGMATKYAGDMPKLAGYKEQLAVTPDGNYLFVAGIHEEMHRFGIKNGKARLEQSSPRIAQGRVDIGVQVSPDSKFVTLPCYAGNYTAGKYGNIFVYPVQNIERAEATLEFGSPSGMAISADPASGKFYASGLIVFDKTGKKEAEYKLGTGDIKQMLVHPQGGKIVLLGTSKFLVAEVPAK